MIMKMEKMMIVVVVGELNNCKMHQLMPKASNYDSEYLIDCYLSIKRK